MAFYNFLIDEEEHYVDLISTETGELVETLGESDFNSRYRICTDCGVAGLKEDMTYCESAGDWYCPDCRDENLFQCADCDRWYPCDEAIQVHDGWRGTKLVCEDCAIEYGAFCDNCGEFHEWDDLIHCVDTDNYFCRHNWRCYRDLHQCADCEEWFEYDDNVYWNDRDEEYYCERCYEYHESGVSSYHSHDYDDFRCLDGEKRGQDLFMGFELETCVGDRRNESDVVDYTESEFGSYFAMEEDGSIGNGIEFITQPCTLSYHLDQLPAIADWTRYLVRHGYDSHNSGRCGFHVHLDKKYFGKKLDSATAKLLFIFERHWDNLLRFSRRNANQVRWCKPHDNNDCMETAYNPETGMYEQRWCVPGKKLTSIMKAPKDYDKRYRAVNLQPSSTIEIRLWRGSLNMETIEATLKFTARLAELCKKASAVELNSMTFDDLLGDDPVIRSYWERVKNRAI